MEELALDENHEGFESHSDEEMQTDEQVAQQAEVENQEIPDDSVQGFYEHKGDFFSLEPVYCVTLHPLLPIAATGGGDDQSMMWNYQSGELIAVLASNYILFRTF